MKILMNKFEYIFRYIMNANNTIYIKNIKLQ